MKPEVTIDAGSAKLGAAPHRRGHPDCLPERLYPGGRGQTNYGSFKDTVLSDIMRRTQSAPEYFCCIRAYQGLLQKELADFLKCDQVTISDFERGRLLPPARMLEKLHTLFPLNGERYENYEAVLIRNRVALAREFVAMGKAENAASVMNEMPRAYWFETLARFNHPERTADPAQPVWADMILPITHRGDYLRTVRLALGLTAPQAAQRIGKSQNAVSLVEHNDRNGYAPTRDALIALYQQEEATQRATSANFPAEPLFVPERLNAFEGYSGVASRRFGATR